MIKTPRGILILFAIAQCAAFILIVATADAQEGAESEIAPVEEVDRPKLEGDLLHQFRFVAKDLRCPTCQGMSVLESDAAFSRQIKDMVEAKVREGWSKQRILDFFTERYGPWILREPPKEGFSLIAWVVPLLLLLCGPICLWVFSWRKRTSIPTEGVRSRGEILEEMINSLETIRVRQTESQEQ